MNVAVDGENLSKSIGIVQRIKLPNYCGVLQVELLLIQTTARVFIAANTVRRDIIVLSGSQTAIKALDFKVKDFEDDESLLQISQRGSVTI